MALGRWGSIPSRTWKEGRQLPGGRAGAWAMGAGGHGDRKDPWSALAFPGPTLGAGGKRRPWRNLSFWRKTRGVPLPEGETLGGASSP